MEIKTLTYLPGYYQCNCGARYISDIPFKKACCLECGKDMDVEVITHEQLDKFLQDLGNATDDEPCNSWGIKAVAQVVNYEDTEKALSLMRFFKDKGYVSFIEDGEVLVNLEVHGYYIRINYLGYSREQRLEMALRLGKELAENYSFEKYQKLLDICKDDIFYCDGGDNDFYIEDEHFVRKE